MPQNADGSYRPLTSVQKTDAANYAAELIRRGGLSDKEIVQKVGQRFGFDNADYLRTFTLVRQAHKEVDVATKLGQNPNYIPPPTTIGNIPRQPEDKDKFVYDVLVVIKDPVTGEQTVTRMERVSDNPLSLNDIRQEVDSQRDQFVNKRSTSISGGTLSDRAQIDVFILGVGRGA